MSTVIAAWGTYIAVIGIIYSIGQKAAEFLSDFAQQALSHAPQDHLLSKFFSKITDVSIHVMDITLLFEKIGPFFLPRLYRTVIFSGIMLLSVWFIFRTSVMWPLVMGPITIQAILSSIFIWQFVFVNVVTDYISFAKTRSLIHWTRSIRPIFREAFLLPVDVLLSLIIVVFTTLTIAAYELALIDILNSNTLELPTLAIPIVVLVVAALSFAKRKSHLVRVILRWVLGVTMLLPSIYIVVAHSADFLGTILYLGMNAQAQFICALLTSLGIIFASIILTIIEIIEGCIRQLESWEIGGRNIWTLLNFERRPTQAAAVMVIIMFTLAYWPIVSLIVIERSVL